MLFQPDFYPDSTNWLTTITNDALMEPLELNPNDGFIGIYSDYYDEINTLKWGPDLNDPVTALQADQSTYIQFITSYEYFSYIFWQVKSTGCNNYPYGEGCTGTFLGYIHDQYDDPVGDAEIYYTDDYILNNNYNIHHIITDDEGHFFFDGMFARNYHIHKIVFDGINYPTDEYISMEPNDTVNLDFNIYLTEIIDTETSQKSVITNSPNPFSQATTFMINLSTTERCSTCTIDIVNLSGQVAETIEINPSLISGQNHAVYWNTKGNLKSGQYMAFLKSAGHILATHKIIIK